MAMLGCGAPVSEIELRKIRVLLDKIRGGIQAEHRSCLPSEFRKINSSENSEYMTMKTIIGIPPAPVLEALSESVTLDASWRRISEGLQLHKVLLANISKALDPKCQVPPLLHDIRDLDEMISKIIERQAAEEPQFTLHMPGTYDMKLAAHLTLLQLDKFLQNVQQLLMGSHN